MEYLKNIKREDKHTHYKEMLVKTKCEDEQMKSIIDGLLQMDDLWIQNFTQIDWFMNNIFKIFPNMLYTIKDFIQIFVNKFCAPFNFRLLHLTRISELDIIFSDEEWLQFVEFHSKYNEYFDTNPNIMLLLNLYHISSKDYGKSLIKLLVERKLILNEKNMKIKCIRKFIKKICKKLHELDKDEIRALICNKYSFVIFQHYLNLNDNLQVINKYLDVCNEVVQTWDQTPHKHNSLYDIIEPMMALIKNMCDQKYIQKIEHQKYAMNKFHQFLNRIHECNEFVKMICNNEKNIKFNMILEKIKNSKLTDLQQYATIMNGGIVDNISNEYYNNFIDVQTENIEEAYFWGDYIIAYKYKNMSKHILKLCESCQHISLKKCNQVKALDYWLCQCLNDKSISIIMKQAILNGVFDLDNNYNESKMHLIDGKYKISPKIEYDRIMECIRSQYINKMNLFENIYCSYDENFANVVNANLISTIKQLKFIFNNILILSFDYEIFNDICRCKNSKFNIFGYFNMKNIKQNNNNNNSNNNINMKLLYDADLNFQLFDVDEEKIDDIIIESMDETRIIRRICIDKQFEMWHNGVIVFFNEEECDKYCQKYGISQFGIPRMIFNMIFNEQYTQNNPDKIIGRYPFPGEKLIVTKTKQTINLKRKKIGVTIPYPYYDTSKEFETKTDESQWNYQNLQQKFATRNSDIMGTTDHKMKDVKIESQGIISECWLFVCKVDEKEEFTFEFQNNTIKTGSEQDLANVACLQAIDVACFRTTRVGLKFGQNVIIRYVFKNKQMKQKYINKYNLTKQGIWNKRFNCKYWWYTFLLYKWKNEDEIVSMVSVRRPLKPFFGLHLNARNEYIKAFHNFANICEFMSSKIPSIKEIVITRSKYGNPVEYKKKQYPKWLFTDYQRLHKKFYLLPKIITVEKLLAIYPKKINQIIKDYSQINIIQFDILKQDFMKFAQIYEEQWKEHQKQEKIRRKRQDKKRKEKKKEKEKTQKQSENTKHTQNIEHKPNNSKRKPKITYTKKKKIININNKNDNKHENINVENEFKMNINFNNNMDEPIRIDGIFEKKENNEVQKYIYYSPDKYLSPDMYWHNDYMKVNLEINQEEFKIMEGSIIPLTDEEINKIISKNHHFKLYFEFELNNRQLQEYQLNLKKFSKLIEKIYK